MHLKRRGLDLSRQLDTGFGIWRFLKKKIAIASLIMKSSTEQIQPKTSRESKLQVEYIRSIGIRSRN